MAVLDLYSKRRKREAGEVIDVFTHDPIERPFRVQVVHIWDEVIGVPGQVGGTHSSAKVRQVYFDISTALRREYGVFTLNNSSSTIDRSNAPADLKA